MVGFDVVDQQIPFAVTADPPILVTLPPPVAVVDDIADIFVVVTVAKPVDPDVVNVNGLPIVFVPLI
jgi:hypothetical protein